MDLKQNVEKEAFEAPEEYRTKQYKKKRMKIWNDNRAKLVDDKKRSYLKYLKTKSVDDKIVYK